MKVSDAQKKSAKKYQEKNNKRFSIIMNKQEGEKIEKYYKGLGHSTNSFILQSIKEKIERDTGKSFDEFLNDNQTAKLDKQNVNDESGQES